MELFFRSFVLIASLILSASACAVGMGAINVTSSLGEPLNAEIDLGGIGNKVGNNDDLTARIASPELFKGADLDYPYTLPTLTFAIESRADGKPYLLITSRAPVNDPFVTLLVELNWPTGRLLREYTFLLDPPGFRPEQPATAMVKSTAPIAAASTRRPAAEAANVSSAQAIPAMSTASMPTPAGRTSSGKIIVKRGDTLRRIALQEKSPDVSLERMLVALYRANADEFDGNNMNRIRVGQILRVPSDTAIDKVTQADAMKEIRVQTADWDVYRHKLAAASVTAREPAARQEVSGKISAKVAEIAPASKKPAQEVVKLSKGEMPGDKSVSASSTKAELQDKLAGMQEELTAKDIRLKDNSSRIALLEKNIKEMQHLIELKGQTVPPAKVPESKPEAPAVVPPATAAAPASDASKPQPAIPAAKPVAKPQPVAAPAEVPEPSMMDEFLGNPLYVGGLVVVLLALGGGWFVMHRNRTRNRGWGNLEKSIAEPVTPAVIVGETTRPNPISGAAAREEEIDPISEADLFLNFGRDAQAEEILKDALEKDPKNRRILLKLLSIYLDRKDAKTFYAIAQQVRDLGDSSAWAQVAAMGRNLEPDNPVYAAEPGAEIVAEIPSQEPAKPDHDAQGLDFDLDFGGEKSSAELNEVIELDKPSAAAPLDFDLGDTPAVTGDAAKADKPEDNISQLSGDAVETDQGTQSGFIDLTSTSMSMPVAEVVAGLSATGTDAAPAADDEFLDVTSQSMPFSKPVGEARATPAADSPAAVDDDEFIDITSQSMSFSMPVGEVNAGQSAAENPAAVDDDEVIDITSKSMSLSLPIGEVEVAKPDAGGIAASADDDFIDITSQSMAYSLPVGEVEAAKPDAGGNEAAADDEIFDITSKSMSLPTGGGAGAVASAQGDDSLFQGVDLDLNEPVDGDASAGANSGNWSEVATKIDLAKAYQEMGDTMGAQEILKEVMEEGDAQQRAAAESMLGQLAS